MKTLIERQALEREMTAHRAVMAAARDAAALAAQSVSPVASEPIVPGVRDPESGAIVGSFWKVGGKWGSAPIKPAGY